jgi:excinuclease ABC subunit C
MRESLLDDCPGMSPAKKQRLLKQFGSVTRIKAASADEIASLPGISKKSAQGILDFLGKDTRKD